MILGLDIGRQVVKMATVDAGKQGFTLLDVGEREITDLNQTYDPEKISKPYWVMAIKELFDQKNLKPRRIRSLVSAINGTNASIKQVTTLDMSSDELYSAMVFEARKHIPMDGTDAVVDYQIMGQNTKEVDKIDVGLVACTKRILNSHLSILKDVGLRPGIVDTDATAITNLFIHHYELPEEGVYVVLNIGAVSSTIIVLGRQAQYFTREIPIGTHHMVQEIVKKRKVTYPDGKDILEKDGIDAFREDAKAKPDSGIGVSVASRTIFDNFVEDVRRSLRYYAKSTGMSFFQRIHLTGGGAKLPGFSDFLNSKLNVETILFNPFDVMEAKKEIDVLNPYQYTVAIGLALRGGLHE
ncbi:MAG: type IV pilus assembly protein PilM [Fidelibacterota bacterium]